MDKKLQRKLFRKYPDIFQDRVLPTNQSRMRDGICCGDGWYDIINEACEQLTFLRKELGTTITFFQVKEKLAGLRLYIGSIVEYDPMYDGIRNKKKLNQLVRTIIGYAEFKSYHTCEQCGESNYTGTKRIKSWLYAVCDDCFKKLKKERKIK